MIVKINGWNPGFLKISMNKFLRKYASYDLKNAHDAVELILSGKNITFNSDAEYRAEIEKELTRIGATFLIE